MSNGSHRRERGAAHGKGGAPGGAERAPRGPQALALALAFCLLAPAGASARDARELVDLSFGLKAGGGAEIWTTPDSTQVGTTGDGGRFGVPILTGARGGFNASVGLVGEVRLIRYLAIEAGVLFSHREIVEQDTTLRQDGTRRNNLDTTISWGAIRFPIMFKLTVPLGDNHLWFGVGPEFSLGRDAEADFDIDGPCLTDTLDRAGFENRPECLGGATREVVRAVEQDDLYLTWGLGYVAQVGERARIPIDLRFGWNTDQPDAFFAAPAGSGQGRVDFDQVPSQASPDDFPNTMTVKAQDSFWVELLVGVTFDVF